MNSQNVYTGPDRIEARSLLYATGKLEEEIGKKPLAIAVCDGIANTELFLFCHNSPFKP